MIFVLSNSTRNLQVHLIKHTDSNCVQGIGQKSILPLTKEFWQEIDHIPHKILCHKRICTELINYKLETINHGNAAPWIIVHLVHIQTSCRRRHFALCIRARFCSILPPYQAMLLCPPTCNNAVQESNSRLRNHHFLNSLKKLTHKQEKDITINKLCNEICHKIYHQRTKNINNYRNCYS